MSCVINLDCVLEQTKLVHSILCSLIDPDCIVHLTKLWYIDAFVVCMNPTHVAMSVIYFALLWTCWKVALFFYLFAH